ncbi:hypothetical protein LRR18_07550 [Mangrovimonas sp. AS39]|uniref:hypothetical protein n=1 Tax=Mangrovimonas futianensis TaxID=2895523 RepID=UPI001E35F212|nr:hypothetical protein [Mangrovimonas futianensis]MCF1191435.1 hypothetical protein [Mangrovimonas futianensis]MCF1195130.1 hypothetical protein [Mangrovimonas futianensis]
MKFLKPALFFLFLFLSNCLLAQNDIVLKTNGDEMRGHVTKINDKDIQFIYENETLEYNIPISEIIKITFSSGRIEYFDNHEKVSFQNLEDHHNKVAILPFGYIKDQETSNATMTKKIQLETYTIFKNKAVNLQFQDPNTTNSLLIKAGLTNNNIEGYTMGEICNILGVEYVVQGLVSIERSSVTGFSNTQTTKKDNRNNAYVDGKGHIVGDISNKSKTNSSSFNTTTQNYSTNITMNIYNDKGDNVFSKEHSSFWQTEDAYKITLDFLARKTPFFKK